VLYLLYYLRPDAWRWGYQVKLAANLGMLLASCLYVYGVIHGLGDDPSRDRPLLAVWSVLGGRFLGGVAMALVFLQNSFALARICPRELRPKVAGDVAIMQAMGTVVGPLLPTVLHMLNPCLPDGRFTATGCAIGVLGGVGLITAQLLYPRETEDPRRQPDFLEASQVEEERTARSSSSSESQKPQLRRNQRNIVILDIVLTYFRGFSLHCLLASSVMILDVGMGWHFVAAGLAVSLTGLSVLPMKKVFDSCGREDCLGSRNLLRLMGLISVLAAMLFFSFPCALVPKSPAFCAGTLLLGDALVYASITVTYAIARGIGTKHQFDRGLFRVENAQVVTQFSTIPNFFAPILARSLVHLGGRDFFAALILGLLLILALVAEQMHRLDDWHTAALAEASADGEKISP